MNNLFEATRPERESLQLSGRIMLNSNHALNRIRTISRSVIENVHYSRADSRGVMLSHVMHP